MATGVKYNDIFSSNSKSTKLVSGVSLIKEELALLINFPKYGLFFGNEMGIDLEKYLYLQNKIATFNLIKADIEDLFKKYGRAQITKIEMSFDESNSAIIINVEVLTGSYNQPVFNLSFTIAD